MSALTKLFVVLLVICSLLVSASVVVYVNRVEDFRKHAEISDQELAKARTDNAKIAGDLSAAKTSAAQFAQTAQGRQDALQGDLTAKQNELNNANIQIAQLNSAKAGDKADIARLTLAQESIAKENTDQAAIIAELRARNDDVAKKNTDLNMGFTEMDSKLKATENQLRYTEENNQDLKGQNDTLKKQILALGGTPGGTIPAVALGSIKGTIKDVRRIGGNLYATINVGSSSNVTKGMEFNAINTDNGDFLGVVKIDRVDADEAIGQVNGPRINEIKTGTSVRTQ